MNSTHREGLIDGERVGDCVGISSKFVGICVSEVGVVPEVGVIVGALANKWLVKRIRARLFIERDCV